MSSKSLLGIRLKFTEKKYNQLHEAYEDLALAEDLEETQNIMNR
ncbi:unnamed protein product [Paramecium octaurelia]|uniref:Uncharacterized protein n=1 Tax=Paramecium octaurelia TaxID=43137 RepID=A0A8S1TYJ3_PAROT|nr:unnamed protein product [Paramecium octaurelia]